MARTVLRRNPDRTRRRLLDASIRLFVAHGYNGVSVDQIVAAARVNKRMVYHYFGNKTGIFEAALADVYSRIEKVEFNALDSGASATEKLRQLLRGYFSFLEQHPEFTKLLLWENLERRRAAKLKQYLTKDPFISRFRATVDDGIRAGELRADLDVPHLLIHFIGLCFIYHSNRFSLSQGLKMDLGDARVREAGLEQVLSLVFQGIAGPRAEDEVADAKARLAPASR
jgi:AcrR family transcriptional regulator